jgi:mannose-6-phosphate isomerase
MSSRRRPAATPHPTVRLLEGVRVAAAWGSPALLAPYGVAQARPGGVPDAEIWFGAHPRHPSPVIDADARTPAESLADDERPSFLVKLLAADSPLSIQVHPDDGAAQAGFAAEERAGVPIDATERRFVDPEGKPELIRALGPMRVLCGLRSPARSRLLLSLLAPSGIDALLETLARGEDASRAAVTLLLRADPAERAAMLAAVEAGAAAVLEAAEDGGVDGTPSVDDGVIRLAGLALDLARRFPDDAGTLVALLLEDVDLAEGDALFVAPGTPHAYLSGLAVEVMNASDNVLRGGMTVKHVDVEAFLDVLDTSATGTPSVGTFPRRADGSGWQRRVLPSDAFVVDEASVRTSLRVERSGVAPSILLCLTGELVVQAQDGTGVRLTAGAAALLGPGVDPVELKGQGDVVHATRLRPVGSPVGREA